MTHQTPRIAVAMGDPAGISPELLAKLRGYAVEGRFPSDTVWLRARRGDYDVVLTMYHDQGQIALKLMGFERGVTIFGGMTLPICTPAARHRLRYCWPRHRRCVGDRRAVPHAGDPERSANGPRGGLSNRRPDWIPAFAGMSGV